MAIGTNRLALRHLITIVLVSVLFSLVALAVQVRTQYTREVAARDDVLHMIGESYRRPVAAGVFFFDYQQLELLVEGILLLPYVEAVMIVENRPGDPHTIVSVGDPDSPEGTTHLYPLEYEHNGVTRHVGNLLVVTCFHAVRQRTMEQLAAIAATSLLQVFTFALVVLVVDRRMIFRHLRDVAGFAHAFDPEHISERRLVLQRSSPFSASSRPPDELDEITDAFNAMLGRLDCTIRELEGTQESLETALGEKQALLQELYHRSNNTMQSIRAMLSLRAAGAPDGGDLQAMVREVDNRILAMALVHRKLYESRNLSKLDMLGYLTELTRETLRSYDSSDRRIQWTIDVDGVSFLIDTAIPCGLILSELLSNVARHAFPGERRGTVTVSLHQVETNRFRLIVADDGVGFGESLDYRNLSTMGLPTVMAIAEQQLRGSVQLSGQEGTRWEITFSNRFHRERVRN